LLLVLGLGTRFAALGLIVMISIVELTVPGGWPIHLTWAAMALGIMAWGPGLFSLDYALARIAGLPFSPQVSSAGQKPVGPRLQ
jgi:putative oxidoreductase